MARRNFSEKREAIYNLIRNTTSHPSAEWVYNQLKPQYPNISLGTVYRNMAMFAEQGLIMSVGTVNGRERFDANTTPHAHFICNKCSAVIDLDYMQYNKELDESVLLNTGHSVEKHAMFFYGICRKCNEDNLF
ncbi:MAG: transcriptional repressor [Acutalibacteraceae bacterium]|nr:transcriptional repressor [Acutalibacteraceae bacterium]MEE0265756.1 transcriptional repressor [Acutalibacteraceae bacterium]